MITVLTSSNKETFLIPSKSYSQAKKGKWIMKIESLSIEGLSVFLTNKVSDLSEEQIEILKEANDKILINGKKLIDFTSSYEDFFLNEKFIVNVNSQDAVFGIFSDYNGSFEFTYSFYKGSSLIDSGSVYNRENYSAKEINYSKVGNPLENKKSSFAVLRTNPKLTGNIKLVVDSSMNLYLDTFKVSNKLTNIVYRHAKVSGEGQYANDIRNIFQSLPKGDLYKVPNDSLDAHKMFIDYNKQYETEYNYGARTNDDKLYNENFRILAPLWINQVLPDFFAVFRIEESYNLDSYQAQINDKEKFNEFLKNGKLIKLYDMRRSSPLGTYLYNHYNEISQYPGSVYLQFVEQEQNDSINWQGKNSWIGISVDKGIIVKKTETSYFANKILNESEGIQEKFNSFLMEGFERNNLVSANLINLEFLFDDKDAESYKMHRYFGLYLKENDFLTYQYIDKKYDQSTQAEKIYKYDSSSNIIDDSFIVGQNGILQQSDWSNRMFFALSPFDGVRLKTGDDLNYYLKNNIANRPYTNIASFPVTKLDTDFSEFITLNFKKALSPGEHLRILIPSYRDETTEKINSLIFEIIMSNDKRLATVDGVFPYVVYNKSGLLSDSYVWYRDQILRQYPDMTGINYYEGKRDQNIRDYPYVNNTWYDSTYEMSKVRLEPNMIDYPNVYRLSVYTQDFEDPNKVASVAEQIRRIAKAIDKFGIDFKVRDYNKENLSIVSKYTDTTFQRITSNILNANIKEDSIHDKIKYFGNPKLEFPTYRLNYNSMEYSSNDFVYAPLDFELLGDRETTIIKFVKNNNLYQVSVDDFSKILPISLYKNTSGNFKSLNNFDIITYKMDDSYRLEIVSTIANSVKTNVIQSPIDLDTYVISTEDNILIEDYKVNLYKPCPCQISLMGMLNVCDFDSYINYSTSQEVASNVRLAANVGDVISIGVKDRMFLERLKLYKLVEGKFRDLNLTAGKNFFIVDSSIFYGSNGLELSESISSTIEPETNCIIESVGNLSDYDFSVSNNIMSEVFFFNENDANNNLNWPLTIPTIGNWESVGTYFDTNSVLDVKTLNKEYNTNLKTTDGFIPQTKSYIGTIYPNQYIKSGLDYLIKNVNGKYESFKDYLLDASSLGNTINTYLSDEVAPVYTIGYYNKYVNTLEFILSGIKFGLSFNNANFNAYIRLSEYNNYGVFLMNDYNPAKKNEILINTGERTILVVNHQFNLDNAIQNQVNMSLNSKNNNIELNTEFKFVESPYILRFDKAYGNSSSVKIPVDKTNTGSIDGSLFYQLEKFERPNPYLDGTDAAIYFDNSELKAINGSSIIVANSSKGFISNFNSERDMILSTLDPSTMNESYMNRKSYLIDPSIHISEDPIKSSYENFIDNYIASFTNEMTIYIKNNEGYITIDQTNEYYPLIIQASRPKNIKFNYGYFLPRFVDMFSFDLNETELIETCGMDFNSCNTSFKDIDTIKNLYCSKVFNDFSNIELKKNYYILPEFSLVNSNWDKGFYRQYTSENNYSEVNGVVPGIEDTTFFGSSCIKTKDKENIIITDFSYSNCLKINDLKVGDYSTTKKETTYDNKEISVNLTLSLYNYFINNETFLSNWKDFQYNDTYIKNYIKNSLQKYFKIDQKRNVVLKESSSDNDFIFNIKSPENSENYTEVKNFKSTYIEDNEDIICKIVLENWKNKSFYIELNLNNAE